MKWLLMSTAGSGLQVPPAALWSYSTQFASVGAPAGAGGVPTADPQLTTEPPLPAVPMLPLEPAVPMPPPEPAVPMAPPEPAVPVVLQTLPGRRVSAIAFVS